jgi:hypothetical protein
MGAYSVLYIGTKNFWSFKYSEGAEAWKEIGLIFKKEDFGQWRLNRDGIKRKKCIGYRISIKEAKKRLNEFHITLDEIDKNLSILLNIKNFNFDLIDENNTISDEYEGTEVEEKYYEVMKKLDYINIDNYTALRALRKEIDQTSEKQSILLDFKEIVENEEEILEIKNEFNEKIINSEIKIRRNYLSNAKVFFTTCDYDLVYIYLIVALEKTIMMFYDKNKFRFIKVKKQRLDFMTKVNLIFELNKEKFSEDVGEKINKIYNKRNSIIHYGGIKEYNRKMVCEDIYFVEEVITNIKQII